MLTGAGGFLGKVVFNTLSAKDYELVGICSNSNKVEGYISCDLSNQNELINMEIVGFDIVLVRTQDVMMLPREIS